jgi:hypothetical protein
MALREAGVLGSQAVSGQSSAISNLQLAMGIWLIANN